MEGPLVFLPVDGPLSTQCTLLHTLASHFNTSQMERSDVPARIDGEKFGTAAHFQDGCQRMECVQTGDDEDEDEKTPQHMTHSQRPRVMLHLSLWVGAHRWPQSHRVAAVLYNESFSFSAGSETGSEPNV